jgi:DNA polymerase-3 subunit alpha
MRDVLRKMQPDCLEDIIALVSLYRPGPMDNIPLYISRKHGTEKVEYLHPLLESIMGSTYGIMIYQEQVMQTAREMGGYSLAGADILRRAMGKKVKEEMQKNRRIFTEGAKKKGIRQDIAEQVFTLMEKFAGYGFNRSHAAAYALISYQTAYLKANYRREFYIGSMNAEITSIEKIATFVQDAKRSGITILPPDVNLSEEHFTGEGENSIRYALGGLKGSGISFMRIIVSERKKNGPFKDIFNFCRRTKSAGVSIRQVESLTLSGAFDSIHNNRRQIFESMERLSAMNNDSKSKQKTLFEQYKADVIELEDVPEWNTIEKLDLERRSLGFYLNSHPMDIYSEFLKGHNITRSKDFTRSMEDITIAGMLLTKREKFSKNGQKYAFLTISDQDNSFDVTVFPDLYIDVREHLVDGTPLIMVANLSIEAENMRLRATSLRNIENIIGAQKVYVQLNQDVDLDTLHNRLSDMKDGNNAISFIILKPNGQKVEVETKYRKNLSLDNRRLLASISGVCFYWQSPR